ncbi:Glutaredoxin [Holothuria leucospilota]|uniref:Glutaredoxin-2, mitochondrial n=1 Tax=Holothuria leucospilota TaxID=206669 RepID=A0A9Q1BLN3_HOLLE|nr:Glutaredoxin [Holothuria leucospilota]
MVKAFVDAQIKDNKVVVFSKTYCPYCRMAKSALAAAGYEDYALLELDERDDGDAMQTYLAQLTGGRTVPRVFIGGKFVGGGSEVQALQQQGKLVPMLKEVGAL